MDINFEKSIDYDQQIKNLVDWKNPPTVKDLKNDLIEAKSNHSLHVQNVDNWLSDLKGNLKVKPKEGRSKIQPKLIRKQAEWVYASLESPYLSSQDIFDVNPVSHLDEEAAIQNGLVLNKQFRVDIPRVKFINKFVRTAVNTGTVIIKLGWEEVIDNARVEVEVPVYPSSTEELMGFLQQQIETQAMSQEEAQALLQSGQLIQIGVEYKEQIQEQVVVNRPVVQIRDSRDVIIDPTCEGDIDNARFIIDSFTTDLSSLKKDGRYSNLDCIPSSEFNSIVDNGYMNDESKDSSFSFKDKPRQKLRVYEYWGYWDIDDSGIVKPIVASFVGNVMIRLDENPYPDKKLPFVIVQFLPSNDNSVYGEPLAELLKDNQNIIGAVQRGMIDLFGNSANGQQGIAKGWLDPINMQKFKNGDNFEFNPLGDLRASYYMTSYPEVSSSTFNLINFQNAEAEALSGIKAFSQGISGDALGAMLDLETDVPMYDGSFKKVKDLVPNDVLIGKDGKATKIETLFAIDYPKIAYELEFSNGAKVIAGGEHKWSVTDSHMRKYKTVDTDYMYDQIQKNRSVYIPRIKRIDMNGSYPDVDPYCIGYWLGDGNSYRSNIVTMDMEVVDRFKCNYKVVEDQHTTNSKAVSYNIYSKNTQHNRDAETGRYLPDNTSFEFHLRTLGLLKIYGGEKHIPEQYFSAPYNIKLELLRGLMDADGYAHSGSFNVFTQTESRLKDDIIRLLKSMGISPKISKVRTAKQLNAYKKNNPSCLQIVSRKDAYEIGFSCVDNPFFITRKACKYKTPKQISNYRLVNIKIVDKSLMRCLQVDSSDHLFAVTKDYILTHNSVGGIKSALDATAKRELGILRRFSDGLINIGNKIIKMNSVWLSDEEIIRITDNEFVTIKRDDLAGNFDLSVTISTAEEDAQKASELAFLLQTMGNTAPFEVTKMLLSKVATLHKMPKLAKMLDEYEPQPDPLLQEEQQLKVELLKAQIANEQAKAMENQVDVELKQAKTESELAKAGKLGSEKDYNDLNYIERATGLQQERDLEKVLLSKNNNSSNKQ